MQDNHLFFGRKKEIALFEKCLKSIMPENKDKLTYENSPKILNFYGESGVGKTTLATKLIEIVKASYPQFYVINLCDAKNSLALSTQYLKAVTNFVKENKFAKNETLSIINYKSAKNERQFKNNIQSAAFNLEKIAAINPIVLITDLDNMEFYYFLVETFYNRIYGYAEIPSIISIILSRTSLQKGFAFFEFSETLFSAIEVKPLSFEESKLFLNGFFAQFSDDYLKKIYDYTKGKPKQLQFLVDLVKEKQIPAETVLNELIKNEGKYLAKLKLSLEENENLEHNIIAVMTHNLNNKFGALRNDFATLRTIIEKGIKGEFVDEVLNGFYKKLDEATNTFHNTYRILEKKTINPEMISIKDFFNDLKKGYSNEKFTIEIIADKNIKAEIDRDTIKELFQNLIQNAQNHGFTNDKKDYKIVIKISEIEKNEIKYIRILYKNNGNGFIKGFSFEDYKRLAGKSSASTGTGIGGYWIEKVVTLHNGEWNAINLYDYSHEFPVEDDSHEFPVEMEFILPQKQLKI
jgi:signal transduction histidine kinase